MAVRTLRLKRISVNNVRKDITLKKNEHVKKSTHATHTHTHTHTRVYREM